jgi:hypothetical protein
LSKFEKLLSASDSICSTASLVSKDTGFGIGSSGQCEDGLLTEGTSGYCTVFIFFFLKNRRLSPSKNNNRLHDW